MIYFNLFAFLLLLKIEACKPDTTSVKVEGKTDLIEQTPEEKPKVPVIKDWEKVSELPDVLTECSGMISIDGNKYLGHNDSGNKPYLYEFSGKSGDPVRVIKVVNVKNNDWEDIAADDNYIYVGDTGNNGGTRKNLMIYRILKKDVQSKDEVTAEIIKFSYAGQTKFKDSNRHNFDCEAMIVKGDSLFLFSKNRGDFRTDVYGMPKVPGDYTVSPMGSYDSDGLITGADFRINGLNGELVLVGYEIHGKAVYPFILHFPEVDGSKFLEGEVHRKVHRKVLQTESIIFSGQNKVWVSNEEEDGSEGYIYQVGLEN